jgi:hypothetical protein
VGAEKVPRFSRITWRERLADWQQQYTRGIALLDTLAGGDFTTDPGVQAIRHRVQAAHEIFHPA